jgi:AcrR family transcriptional regulator
MPARQLPFKRRISRPARRKLIEDFAAKAFAEKGYDGVSLDEIAHAAGISKTTLYDHFASKRQLHRELLAGSAAEMLSFMRQRVQTVDGPARERMHDALDAFFEFVQTRPFAWRMLFREPPRDAEVAAGSRFVQAGASANVASLLVDLASPASPLAEPGTGQSQAERELQIAVLAEALKWAQSGLASWWYDHPELPRSVIVDGLMNLVWPGLEQLLSG